jgi:hypothetical protein
MLPLTSGPRKQNGNNHAYAQASCEDLIEIESSERLWPKPERDYRKGDSNRPRREIVSEERQTQKRVEASTAPGHGFGQTAPLAGKAGLKSAA